MKFFFSNLEESYSVLHHCIKKKGHRSHQFKLKTYAPPKKQLTTKPMINHGQPCKSFGTGHDPHQWHITNNMQNPLIVGKTPSQNTNILIGSQTALNSPPMVLDHHSKKCDTHDWGDRLGRPVSKQVSLAMTQETMRLIVSSCWSQSRHCLDVVNPGDQDGQFTRLSNNEYGLLTTEKIGIS